MWRALFLLEITQVWPEKTLKFRLRPFFFWRSLDLSGQTAAFSPSSLDFTKPEFRHIWAGPGPTFGSRRPCTRYLTPKRVTSWRGPFPRDCAWATHFLSKKCCNDGEPLTTLCLIWPAWDLNLKPPAPRAKALRLDQLIDPEKNVLKHIITITHNH